MYPYCTLSFPFCTIYLFYAKPNVTYVCFTSVCCFSVINIFQRAHSEFRQPSSIKQTTALGLLDSQGAYMAISVWYFH